MMTNNISQPLWRPDEEILATSLNLRERRYGGNYLSDNFGISDGLPIISFATQGTIYGSGIKYGLTWYGTRLNSGLVVDSIDIYDQIPTIIFGSTFGIYDNSDIYGFISYGGGSFLLDNISFGETTPIISTSVPQFLYLYGEYGFSTYGANDFIEDLLSITDQTPIVTSSLLTTSVYGSKSYGFCVYSG